MTDQNRIYFLNRYINGGYFTLSGGMISMISPSYMFRKNAKLISKLYSAETKISGSPAQIINVPAYAGKNMNIASIRSGLLSVKEYIFAGLVHGSFATGEEIPYSDFDGLLILSDDLFTDERKLASVASALHNLRKPMHRLDPLQHHGWFVLAEKDMQNYPEWFLPVAVLNNSRSLIGSPSIELRVQEIAAVDFKKSFFRLCESLQRKLAGDYSRWNLYQLKAIFSEFMMVPSSYVQARDKKGVFKKYSFKEMKKDFSDEEYAVMDEVSSIRTAWITDLDSEDLKFLGRIDFLSWKKRQSRRLDVPVFIDSFLSDGLFSRMNNFVALSKYKIQNLS